MISASFHDLCQNESYLLPKYSSGVSNEVAQLQHAGIFRVVRDCAITIGISSMTVSPHLMFSRGLINW